MLRASLATIGLLLALVLGACEDPGDGQMPPQEPVPGTTPPATQ